MKAVEWLQVQIKNCPTAENLMNNIDGFLMEAKEMEKQQIIDAYGVGYLTDFKLNSDYTTQTPEQYYNETFKSE